MGIFDKFVRSFKGTDPHVLRGHATRLEFTDLARTTAIREEELLQILQTVATEYFPQRRLEAWLNDSGRGSLHCLFRVCARVVDAATECTVSVAQRVDPDAEVGDEIGVEICAQAIDAERAQHVDDEYGAALGLFTNVPAFRRALQQRLGERLGLDPLSPVEVE